VVGATNKKQQKTPLLPESFHRFLNRSLWRLGGLFLAAIFVAGAVSIFSHNPGDPTLNLATEQVPTNLLGIYGAYASDIMLQTMGYGSGFFLIIFATWGWRIFTKRRLPWIWVNFLALPFYVTFACAMLAVFIPPESLNLHAGLGGLLGAKVNALLNDLELRFLNLFLPFWANGLIFLMLTIPTAALTLGLEKHEWRTGGDVILHGLQLIWHYLVVAIMGIIALARGSNKEIMEADPKPRAKPIRKTRVRSETEVGKPKPRTISGPKKTKKSLRDARESQTTLDFGEKKKSKFKLPTLNLLTKAKAQTPGANLSRDALEQNARLLESVLDDFGIGGEICDVKPGPVVTLYELEPAKGLKASRVIGLADDIARSMSALSARVAVLPGTSRIGIELPNSTREMVYLRELLSSSKFEAHNGALPMVLGKDIGGGPIIADLATMPHLLVAGTTGSGKSVGINTMIVSLLYRFTPDECKFIMVDPKMLELSVYADIPHLLTPVVTEAKKAVVALKWAVREMEERYRAMSKLGVRNLKAYNEMVATANKNGETITRKIQTGFDKDTGQPMYEMQEFDFVTLPLIVVIIDEMADLMQTAGKDVEGAVQRLAQMARAAGIHLIMATQRPSVDVITGTIKANFPTRISFSVTTKIDSRTILGEQGAEQLLGKGDMLYQGNGGRTTRVHGPFVSDQEVENIVTFLKKQGAPSYVADVTVDVDEEGFDEGDSLGPNAADSLYDQAVAIVLRDRKASTSYIQRKLKIGYNKAANLIEDMEQQGVISTANHAGKREILVPDHSEEF
jgi:S-DNA-T family DNA segregation ATPase FtsK/SpoIIIE